MGKKEDEVHCEFFLTLISHSIPKILFFHFSQPLAGGPGWGSGGILEFAQGNHCLHFCVLRGYFVLSSLIPVYPTLFPLVFSSQTSLCSSSSVSMSFLSNLALCSATLASLTLPF